MNLILLYCAYCKYCENSGRFYSFSEFGGDIKLESMFDGDLVDTF